MGGRLRVLCLPAPLPGLCRNRVAEPAGGEGARARAGSVEEGQSLPGPLGEGLCEIQVVARPPGERRRRLEPLRYLKLVAKQNSEVEAVEVLQTFVDAALREGVFLSLSKYTFLD